MDALSSFGYSDRFGLYCVAFRLTIAPFGLVAAANDKCGVVLVNEILKGSHICREGFIVIVDCLLVLSSGQVANWGFNW